MKRNHGRKPSAYQVPVLKRLGKISDLTLKTGSQADFGSNKYTA